jgi:hypothetical protein
MTDENQPGGTAGMRHGSGIDGQDAPNHQDQELMLDENGLGDHGTEAARAEKPGDCNDDMNEKHDEMAHHSIVERTANAGNYGAIYQFAIERKRSLILGHPGKRSFKLGGQS